MKSLEETRRGIGGFLFGALILEIRQGNEGDLGILEDCWCGMSRQHTYIDFEKAMALGVRQGLPIGTPLPWIFFLDGRTDCLADLASFLSV